MIDFSTLPTSEQTLIMVMAYFSGEYFQRKTFLRAVERHIEQDVFTMTFNRLVKRGVITESRYHYRGDKEYTLEDGMVIPAIHELFQAQNDRLLQNTRRAWRQITRNEYPNIAVRQIITLTHPQEREALASRYFLPDSMIYYKFADLLPDKNFKEVFEQMEDSTLLSCANHGLRKVICNDEPVDWKYLKDLLIDSRQKQRKTISKRELSSIFAFYYYLASGEICIDLSVSPVNPFTLQIAAINALYKGDYPLAYKLYTKAMTANNKLSPEKGIFVNPISNYYFVLTMLLTRTETALKKITSLMKKKGASQAPNYFLLKPLETYFCDKTEADISKSGFKSFLNKDEHAAAQWLTWMVWHKFGNIPEDAKPPVRPPHSAFLRHELETASTQERLAEYFKGPSLFSRIEVKSIWQLRLEEIIASNQQAESTVRDKENQQTQLIYLLRYDNIVPILKKRLKNGNWSVGKESSIRELRSLKEDCMDDIDKNLAISLTPWDYDIYISQYIPMLAGCNHVYTGSTYDLQPVNVHEEKPFLIIDKSKKGTFNVSSNIANILDKDDVAYYRKNSDTDYSVFHPSPFELKVYDEILSQKTYPAEAEPLLIKLIATIGEKTEIHSNMVAERDNLQRVDVPPRITLRIVPTNGNLFHTTASVRVTDSLAFVPTRGNVTTVAELDGKQVQLVRNYKEEKKNMKKISEALMEADFLEESEEWIPDSITDALSLPIQTMLPLMQWCKENEDVCCMEWAEGSKLSYHPAISSRSANIAIKPKNGWFEVEGNVEISDGQILSLQKLLEAMHQSGRQKFIRIGENEYITLSTQLSRILKRLDTVTSESRSHLQMAPAAISLLGEMLDDETLNIQHGAAVSELRHRIEESSKRSPSVPAMLQAQLRDYQEEGFEWMSKVTAWGAGVCLADDMGLGKTLQTITLLLEQCNEGPSLVVAPASVVPNWRNELRRFSPTLNIIQLNLCEDRQHAINEAGAGDIVLITYALLNIHQKELTGKAWNVVCLDEAHTIKNSNTKMSKAAMQLRAQRKVILTGTPIQNHLAELWNLFQFINPGLLGSAEQFRKKFVLPIEGEHDKDRQSQLRRLISPFLLRRTKSEVIEELPEKNEIHLPIELSSDEMTLYEINRRKAEATVRADRQLKVSTLAEITRLRQMACSCSLVDKKWKVPSSKSLAFIDLAENLNDSGNRALVFSQFTSFLDEIRKAMDKAGLPYLYLDGSTPMAKREQLVRDFQTGKCPFFLISLKAGGLGLNLTGANYVIHLDPWWNPAIEQQATDRAYRIGQQQDVTVYHLISQHTIEEKILRLHKNKRGLADSLLEGSDMAHAITQEEMLELLQDN
ncbi:MAG: DEAD/DEAH box helicase [Prevotella sp.]|nr:DEAD/DEAH box helicase [Prevotella sp.]